MRTPLQGVGAYDATYFDVNGIQGEERIAAELSRLERARADLLIDSLGPVSAKDRVLHTGRSAQMVSALEERFGCSVDQFSDSGTDFSDGRFDAVVDDDIYVARDLFAHCAQLSRLLRPRGRYVFATWCINDQVSRDSRHIKLIEKRVGVPAQPRAKYFAALTSNGFVPFVIADLTRQAIPYWQLRQRSAQRTGIEQAFLDTYLSQAACLMLVASERFASLRRPRSRPPRRACAPEMPPLPPSTDSPPSFGLSYY